MLIRITRIHAAVEYGHAILAVLCMLPGQGIHKDVGCQLECASSMKQYPLWNIAILCVVRAEGDSQQHRSTVQPAEQYVLTANDTSHPWQLPIKQPTQLRTNDF